MGNKEVDRQILTGPTVLERCTVCTAMQCTPLHEGFNVLTCKMDFSSALAHFFAGSLLLRPPVTHKGAASTGAQWWPWEIFEDHSSLHTFQFCYLENCGLICIDLIITVQKPCRDLISIQNWMIGVSRLTIAWKMCKWVTYFYYSALIASNIMTVD